ncbi:MAG: NifB/NifX family molybdenum-iron cluster-binding protein [Candidatus Thorarchaeota archaeon]
MMRIAFASINEGLESELSPHFGRCPYYVFVDLDNDTVKSVTTKNNPYYSGHQPGVVPQFVAQEGANVIVAGGMGPRAIDWFNQLGVTPITTVPRKINAILKDYIEGKLAGAESCKDHDKS